MTMGDTLVRRLADADVTAIPDFFGCFAKGQLATQLRHHCLQLRRVGAAQQS
jgi:hypothetical protein